MDDLLTELRHAILAVEPNLAEASRKIYKDTTSLRNILEGSRALQGKSLALILSRLGIERDHGVSRRILLLWLQDRLGVDGPRLLQRTGLEP